MRSTLLAKRLYAHCAGMAANKPIAVATSASEICGATTAMVTSCNSPRPWNAPMMPQTVPNRPMYGLTEPTLARNSRLRSSRPTSRVTETCMARSVPSITMRGSCAFRCRWRANSRNPDSKMVSMPFPPSSPPRLPTSRNSCARSPPDQNRSSKRSAVSSATFVCVCLRMMITHDRNENTSSISSTSCTGTLDCAMRVKTFSPPFMACRCSARGSGHRENQPRRTVPRPPPKGRDWDRGCRRSGQRQQIHRDLRRPHTPNINAGNPHVGLYQAYSVRTDDSLGEQDTGCATLRHSKRHRQFIIQQGWMQEVQLHVADEESQTTVPLQAGLVDAAGTQPLGACALQEAQVTGVVHDATGVGVFPVHAYHPCKRRGLRHRAAVNRRHRRQTGRLPGSS